MILNNKFKIRNFAFIPFFAFLLNFNLNSQVYTGKVNILDNPSPGYIRIDNNFLANFDNYGLVQFLDTISVVRHNQYTYMSNGKALEIAPNQFYIYDDKFNLIDSIPYLSQYKADFHAVLNLKNGHYLLLYQETNTMDLSQQFPDGHPEAKVTTHVLIETDRTGEIYWEWKSKDYLNIQDVTEDVDITQEFIRLTHINSLFEDNDGNILVSVRNYDEVIKINKASKQIMWRFGGSKSKNNQFTFLNDNIDDFVGFSHQHTVTELDNGNILLFDNGNLKRNPYSRVVEYHLDHINKTAEKVWEYRISPDYFATAMGSAFRLPNGNTLINWTNKIQEVTPDKKIKFELVWDNNRSCYRALKFTAFMQTVTKNIFTKGEYSFADSNNITNVKLDLESFSNSSLVAVEKHFYAPPVAVYKDSSFQKILPYRWVISNNGLKNIKGKIYINLNNLEGITDANKLAIYWRKQESKDTFRILNTYYDKSHNQLYANINDFGEFCIGVINKLVKFTTIYPTFNQFSINPNTILQWEKQYISSIYQVQISTSFDYKIKVIDLIVKDSSWIRVSGLNYDTQYYWRVRAINNSDTTEWTDITYFNTQLPLPEIITPYDGMLNFIKKNKFEWLTYKNANRYQLQISNNNDFSKLIYNNSNIKSNIIEINNLVNNTYYFYRIKQFNDLDSSDWVNVNFRVGYNQPQLSSPKDKSKDISIAGALYWNEVEEAKNYYVQISETLDFTKVISQSNKIILKYYGYNLEAGKKYYWRVKAFSIPEDDNWSEVWSFSTQLLPPELKFPINLEEIDSNNIHFEWKTTQNSEKYLLQISTSEDFTDKIYQSDSLVANELILKELNSEKQYYWRVKAINHITESNWSSIYKFKTKPKILSFIENSELNDLLISPNPASDFIEIKLPFLASEIRIYNSIGECVKEFSNNNQFEAVALDITSLPAGIYYLKTGLSISKFIKH